MVGKRPSKTVGIARVVLAVSVAGVITSLLVLFFLSMVIREQALRDMARDEARQVSGLVFQGLYSAMRKGWNKAEIQETVERFRLSQPDLRIRVFRGDPVIRQFGDIDGEAAVRDRDPLLQRAFIDKTDILTTEDQSIRYIYPVLVKEECLACHKMARVGEVNGIIDITYPVHNLKVSLNFILTTLIVYFTVTLVILFAVLYYKLRTLIARPIVHLVGVMKEIIADTDLSKRVEATGPWLTEVKHLTDYFNRLLRTIGEYQEQLEEYSIKDPLTKLYNRRKFDDFLRYEVDRSERHGHSFSLLMVDLDNFKRVNDTFGHPVGDLALKELAAVMSRALRRTDLLARLGGDEFAALLPETTLSAALLVAEKLRRSIAAAQMQLPAGEVHLSASIGVVEFPKNGREKDSLCVGMDVAMYKAKRLGKNLVATVEGGNSEIGALLVGQGEAVRQALDEDRVEAHLQPIVSVATGQTIAYEVLARIRTAEGEVLSAGQFIEAAGEFGIDRDIDERVLIKGLEAASHPDVLGAKLFFNLSSKMVGDIARMKEVPRYLRSQGIDPARVVFEITEREALPRLNDICAMVEELRAEGIQFALDDFGSGFSSFLYLKFLTVDFVKIEGSFIRNLVHDGKDRLIADCINRMAHEFGVVTIAEFVEDAQTYASLRALGVDWAQGYHFGRPELMAVKAVPEAEVVE